jgi:hypothetical protein
MMAKLGLDRRRIKDSSGAGHCNHLAGGGAHALRPAGTGQRRLDALADDLAQLPMDAERLPEGHLQVRVAAAGLFQFGGQVLEHVGPGEEKVGIEQETGRSLRHAAVDPLLDVGRMLLAEGTRRSRSRSPRAPWRRSHGLRWPRGCANCVPSTELPYSSYTSIDKKAPGSFAGGQMNATRRPPLPSAVKICFQAGFLAPGSSLPLPFPSGLMTGQWAPEGSVPRHSGGSAGDSHSLSCSCKRY